MILLLLRKLVELFLFSAVPGFFATMIIQTGAVQGRLFYPVLLIVSLLCAFIFFAGNILMMRRMIRDIENKSKYYFIQMVSFAIYAIFIACVCIFGWKDVRAVMLFHSRVFEVICDPIIVDPTDLSKNLITPTQSMIISTVLYGITCVVGYPWFNSLYEKEKAENKKREEEEYKAAREARRKYKEEKARREKEREEAIRSNQSVPSESSSQSHSEHRSSGEHRHHHSEHRHHRHHYDDDTLYSVKELKKLEKLQELDENLIENHRKKISSRSNVNEKLKRSMKDKILEAGTYEFYSRLMEKQEMGDNVGQFIWAHLKRQFSLGIFLHKGGHKNIHSRSKRRF